MKELKASDVMSTNVVSVSPGATVIKAAKLMLCNQVSGLAVLDDHDRLVGVVSEADLLRRPEIGTQAVNCDETFDLETASHFLKSYGRYVEDVMTTQVASVTKNTPLAEVADMLETMRLKWVPVTEYGKLVGRVSRAGVLRAFVNAVASPLTPVVQ
jgi:CBS-domain-containing membrane protein